MARSAAAWKEPGERYEQAVEQAWSGEDAQARDAGLKIAGAMATVPGTCVARSTRRHRNGPPSPAVTARPARPPWMEDRWCSSAADLPRSRAVRGSSRGTSPQPGGGAKPYRPRLPRTRPGCVPLIPHSRSLRCGTSSETSPWRPRASKILTGPARRWGSMRLRGLPTPLGGRCVHT
jgi:hypothetical protein